MAKLHQCEFFLLRYVPDAVKDEFVNIGVALVEPGEDGPRFADVRFTRDWSRVRCADPLADLEMLAALEDDLRPRLQETDEQREVALGRLRDSLSNAVQLSSTKAILAEDPQAELDELARIYLEARPAPRERAMSARATILAQMRDAFEQAGVWPLLWKKVPAAKYSFGADPLKFDCGYKPNGVVRLFHGVVLSEADTVKALAYSFPNVREGIYREHRAQTELTAIVDALDAADEKIAFGLETLKKADIATALVASLPQIAERARRELKP